MYVARRVRFPLWLKLGSLFGLAVALIIAIVGWLSFRTELQRTAEERRIRLIGAVKGVAFRAEGAPMDAFRSRPDMQRSEYASLKRDLNRFVSAQGIEWAAISVKRGRNYRYVLDSDIDDPMPVNYPIFVLPDGYRHAFDGETALNEGVVDEWGRWDGAYAPVRATDGTVIGVAEIAVDATRRHLLAQQRVREVVLQVLIGVLLAVLMAILVSRYISRHLERLTSSARRVAEGDLDVEVPVVTHDEVGVLGHTFNEMVRGLREREFIRETFGRFVDEEVAEKLLADPQSVRLGGESREVTILMSDLRGFTPLAERLSPEEMVRLLNRYLSRMADVIFVRGGTINEFVGDAILALFGAPTSAPDDALRAAACAAEMQAALDRFNAEDLPGGAPPLEMGIAVHTGRVIAGNIGSEKRMKYGVVGDAVNLTARIESFTIGGQVFLSEATREVLGDAIEVRGPISVEAKGKGEPIQMYELLAVGPPFAVRVSSASDEERRPIEALPCACFAIDGKRVSATAVPGQVATLGERSADVDFASGAGGFPLFANVKVRLEPPGAPALDDLYAKVLATEPAASGVDGGTRIQLHFTAVPDEAARFLAALR